MLTNLLRYWPLLSIVMILALITGAIVMPDWANAIAMVAVILGPAIAAYSVIHKHLRLHRDESASKNRTARNILVESTGILLAMLLAGILGRYIAGIVAGQVNDELTKLIVSVLTGMSIGLAVGFLVRRAWGRLVRAAS
jgi:hypothetical protein